MSALIFMRRALLSAAAVTLLISLLPPPAQAQSGNWPPQHRRERVSLALEGAASLASFQGNAIGTASDGAGFDAMGLIGAGMFALGGGYQRSTHSGSGLDARVQGPFLEPRLALPFAVRNFTPFVYGRVSRLERRLESGAASLNTTGTGLGGGVGTYIWLAPNVQLNTTVGWTDYRFSADDSGVFPIGTDRTAGSSWTVRAGLSLGFDRWGR